MQPSCILTVNGGSSSIRCAIYESSASNQVRVLTRIKLDGVGRRDAVISVSNSDNSTTTRTIDAATFHAAIQALMNELMSQDGMRKVDAVGHRIVHGMRHSQPQLIDETLLSELQQLHSIDPEHLPFELELVKAFTERFPSIPQIACFDTAFHRSMPEVARTLPLPAAYRDANIERYGFHGLSYAYLMQELSTMDPDFAVSGRVVLAHLGNGASLAAVKDGQCVDTTMSFTPASGIMMATRSGDLDPGVIYYLSQSCGFSLEDIQHALNHDSGMLGVSGISGDVRELLKQESNSARAALALDMFCYQIRKCIGAYAAALGGIDTLIFSGGIGENSPVLRKRICDGLQFLGIHIDDALNEKSGAIISSSESITVRVIRTDEEMMIAKLVMQCRSN